MNGIHGCVSPLCEQKEGVCLGKSSDAPFKDPCCSSGGLRTWGFGTRGQTIYGGVSVKSDPLHLLGYRKRGSLVND